MTRLADISLHNPVSISVLDESLGLPYLTDEESSDDSDSLSDDDYDDDDDDDDDEEDEDELDGFAIPEGLEQYVVLVPSKLRLVCLAAFILQKCKVGRARSAPSRAADGCSVLGLWESSEVSDSHYVPPETYLKCLSWD